MNHEAPRITRRDLIKGITIGTAATLFTEATVVRGLQLYSRYTDETYKKDKDVQPHLKENLKNTGMLLGVHPHENNPQNVPYLSDFNIVGYFGPWDDWTANGAIYTYDGKIPLVSVGPHHTYAKRKPFRYRDLVEQKDRIREQAQRLRFLPTCLFRYGYEMNGDWFPYGSAAQSPREFLDGWNLVTEIVKTIDPNILIVWAPNVDYPIEPYFPGEHDMKPDILALDGYNKHHISLLHARHFQPDPSPAQLFGKDILTLQELDPVLPILISEVGVDYGNSPFARAASFQWMGDALQQVAMYDRVIGICIFAWNKDRGRFDMHEGNWGNILTDEFHDMIQENLLYSPAPSNHRSNIDINKLYDKI